MPTTDAQVIANRENAKKSTGPKTAATKAISSRNAVIHGIFVSIPTLVPEQFQYLQNLFKSLCTDYEVGSATENLLVWDMAVAHFRRQRAIDAENEYYALDQIRFAESNPGEEWTYAAATVRLTASGDLPRMTRYQRTFERTWERKLAELHRLQAARRAREKKEDQEFEESFNREFDATSARALAGVDHMFDDMFANSPITKEARDRMGALIAEARKNQK